MRGRPTRFGRRPSRSSHHPADISLGRDDTDDIGHVVVEFLADRKQSGAIVRAWDDAVAAELAAQYIDLSLEEPDTGIPTRHTRFN